MLLHRSTLACFVLLCCASDSRVWSQEIRWLRSAEEAAHVAATLEKPILVYVRSAGCHYCDLMQRNVWEDPVAASTVMQGFVPLKLTREENAEAIEALHVKGFPATLIFSPQRAFVGRLDGYVQRDKFLSAMREARVASADSQPLAR